MIPASVAFDPLQLGFGLLFERSPLPMLVLDRSSGRLLGANAAAALCLDYEPSRLPDLHLSELFDPQDWRQALESLKPRAPDPALPLPRWRMRTRTGNTMDVELSCEEALRGDVPVCLLLLRDGAAEPCPDLHTQSMLDSLQDGFFHLDAQARFTYLNRHATELLRQPAAALLGRVIWECFPLALGTEHQRQFASAVARRQCVSYDAFYAPWQQWHEVSLFPSGHGVSVWFRDITGRKTAQLRIDQERGRLAAVLSACSDAIVCIDADGCIETFNAGAERMFGRRSADMLGQDAGLLMPQRFRAAHAEHRSHFLGTESGAPRTMGLRFAKGLRSDGEEFDLEGTIAHVKIDDRAVLIATLRDASQKVALEAERLHTRNQLSRLTHRLMSQEKDLVRRIAQMLHDQLGQTVAAIRLVHETMGALRQDADPTELLQLDERLAALIDQAISQVRVVLADLQSPMLDESGLAAALDNELRTRTPAAMQLVLLAAPDVARRRWPSAVEYAAFMVAREAVENAMRHSQASRLELRLRGDALGLHLDIEDNGRGMQYNPDARSGHLGWAGIRERANSVGAGVSMGPGSAGGTCVSFFWRESP